MTFVIFSASGYLFSWSALLKRLVRSGARKGVRSLRMAGVMWKMSAALFLLREVMTFSTCSIVIFLTLKAGCRGGSWILQSCGGRVGMVLLVLCPMVMKKSFSAFAMACGSVCVFFSYVICVGDVRGFDLEGMRVLRICACFLGSLSASFIICWICSFFFLVISLLSWFLYSL